MKSFNKFLVDEGLISPGSNIFTFTQLDPATDQWIIGWLMKQYVF